MKHCAVVATVVLLAHSSSLLAQAQPTRTPFDALGDSLSAVESVAALQPYLTTARSATAARSADPYVQLRQGLILLRQGQITGQRDPLYQAEAALDEAVYRGPQIAWTWYGLAMVKFALDKARAPAKATMHQRPGSSYREAAFDALAEALNADQTFAPAALLLASEMSGDEEWDDKVGLAVRRAAAVGSAGATLLSGRLYRASGNADSALAAFTKYLSIGGDSSIGLLEQARAYLAAGKPVAAAQSYLQGLFRFDSAGRAAYRADIAWVASPRELATLDSLPDSRAASWIQTFWSNRDVEELRAPGERLTEHLRRWNYVHSAFRLPGNAGAHEETGLRALPGQRDLPSSAAVSSSATDVDPLMSGLVDLYTNSLLSSGPRGHRILDDRAVVYMRYGEPDAVAFTIARAGGIPAGVNWKYSSTSTGPLIFHFRCQAYCILERFPISLDGLGSLDARYDIIAGSMSAGHPNGALIERIVLERTRDLGVGLASDGFPQRYKRDLSPLVQVFAVGDGSHGSGRALVVFAIPGDRLRGEQMANGGVAYPLQVRVIGSNARGDVIRIDTVRVFRAPAALKRGAFLSGVAEIALGSGVWDVRILLAERSGDNAGGAGGRLGVRIPSGDKLDLSDPVLGREGSGVQWRAPEGAIPLNPLDAYTAHQGVELYYEASGMVPGQEYRTSIRLQSVTGDKESVATLSYTAAATAPIASFRRTIDVRRLKPGQYRLTIDLAPGAGGGGASRERLINIASQ